VGTTGKNYKTHKKLQKHIKALVLAWQLRQVASNAFFYVFFAAKSKPF